MDLSTCKSIINTLYFRKTVKKKNPVTSSPTRCPTNSQKPLSVASVYQYHPIFVYAVVLTFTKV